MKVVILAGGLGSRLSEYTVSVPKPMVKIGDKPILWHIMKYYAYFGYNDFLIALGYKAESIREYFLNYKSLNSDFTVDLSTGQIDYHKKENIDWKVTLIDTGLETMTGGRLSRLKPFLKDSPFFLTYGDGVSDVDLDALLKFHNNHGKIATLSAVRPTARFGDLGIQGGKVTHFKEKSQLSEGWINGGFFVCNPNLLDFVHSENEMLEREPIERLVNKGQLMAYKHDGFWQCMDTAKHKEVLENYWKTGRAPWHIW